MGRFGAAHAGRVARAVATRSRFLAVVILGETHAAARASDMRLATESIAYLLPLCYR